MEKKKEKDDGEGLGDYEIKNQLPQYSLSRERHSGDMDEESRQLIQQLLQKDEDELKKIHRPINPSHVKKEKQQHGAMHAPLSENFIDNEMWLIAELLEKVGSLETKVDSLRKQQTNKKLNKKSFGFITDEPIFGGVWGLPVLQEVRIALAGATSKRVRSFSGQDLLDKAKQKLVQNFQDLCSIIIAELKKELSESNLEYLQHLAQAGQKLYVFGSSFQSAKIPLNLTDLSKFTFAATNLVKALQASKNKSDPDKKSSWSFSSVLEFFNSTKKLPDRASVSSASSSASFSSSSSSSLSSSSSNSRSSSRRVTFADRQGDEKKHKKLASSSASQASPPVSQQGQKETDRDQLTVTQDASSSENSFIPTKK